MRDSDNENEPLPFVTLAAATALLVNHLALQKDVQSPGKGGERDEQRGSAGENNGLEKTARLQTEEIGKSLKKRAV